MGDRNMTDMKTVDNWDGRAFLPPTTGVYMDVESPVTGEVIGRVAVSGTADVDAAVARASAAFPDWSSRTTKARAAVLFRFKHLVELHAEELAALVTLESGKNHAEALASIAKGNETVEYACSLPQLVQGKKEEVSRGVWCEDVREPLGVVASVVPFNFPIMVPLWTVPMALVTGNTVVLKPSEKVPLTMHRVAQLLAQAGLPPGVFQTVNGTREVVEALCDHDAVKAVTFVGSSPVAEAVATRCRKHHKKVVALGGAKNHLVVLPDADADAAANDIVASFAGAAGQRCMAASVLLLVGGTGAAHRDAVLAKVVAKASGLRAGTGGGQVGAIIDAQSKKKILGYIDRAVAEDGAKCLLDGRGWAGEANGGKGHWVGPTILLHQSASDAACREEIFGPVLSVLEVPDWQAALAVERASPFGNAACVYTSVGAHAAWFAPRFGAAMVGVNVGIPVPREPFAFGGLYGSRSKYGDMDLTGEGGVEFFTNRRKITTRWPLGAAAKLGLLGDGGGPALPNGNGNALPQAAAGAREEDAANFNGQM